MPVKNVSDMSQLEFARTVGVHKLTDTKLRIRIPRFMVNITRDFERISFNRNIFINAPDCKISANNRLEAQNYITVPKTANCDLSHIAVRDDNGVLIIPDNSSVICACFYNDLIFVIDSYMNS